MGFKANARKHQKKADADTNNAPPTEKEGVISCGIKSCEGFADKNMGGRSLSIDNAVETIKGGAFDYLLKPFSAEILVATVNRAFLNKNSPKNEFVPLTPEKSNPSGRERRIVTQNKQMLELIKFVENISYSKSTILIMGDTGTGKEMFARHIHQMSPRAAKPFMAVNCAALPEGLLETELFGHEKGAFTGASAARKGYFEVADGGTIFLDEVGELPLTTQVRLLRVLENGEFIKVGSSQVQITKVRIVAATNLNMQQAIDKEKFREDLYYRLSTIEIHLPPLRNRKEDIHLLFRKFASDFAQKYRMPTIRLDENATKLLLNYRFPGNIRQLRNIAEQISVVEEKRLVTADKITQYLPNNRGNLPALIGRD